MYDTDLRRNLFSILICNINYKTLYSKAFKMQLSFYVFGPIELRSGLAEFKGHWTNIGQFNKKVYV